MAAITQDELGRRLKAAIAYSRLTDDQIAEAAGVKKDTLRHWKGQLFPRAHRATLLRALADATGLPLEFFTADFDYLDELPQHDDPALAADRVSRAARAAAQRRDDSPDRRHEEDRRQGDRRQFR